MCVRGPSQNPKMKHLDESKEHWLGRGLEDLAARCAALHKQRRESSGEASKNAVAAARRAAADFFIRGGVGVEVGAGARPFPLPKGTTCIYGDIRDTVELGKYFSGKQSPSGQFIDAQTFTGVDDESLDFVISAHVIEHLEDPIGAIRNALRVLRYGGRFILVVPDMRYTFDKHRQPTLLEHLVRDSIDGGDGTRIEGYMEFIRDVAIPMWGNETPLDKIYDEALRLSDKKHDIHFHAWTTESFLEVLQHVGASVLGTTQAVNENIFVIERPF